MTAVSAYTEPVEDDDAALFRWRRRRFLELGFCRGDAQLLAWGGIDWHEAERLLAAGCPLRLAFDLLV